MKQCVKRLTVFAAVLALVLTAMPMLMVSAAYENTHVNTGDMAEDIVAVAKTQIGYHEGSLSGTTSGTNNYTKYGVWYGDYVNDSSFDYGQWCAMFVSWCAKEAGIPDSIVYYHAYCPYGVTWFKNKGLWKNSAYRGGSYTPKRGDIIYFSNSSGEAGHIGIVDYVSGSTVYTVEGNTSSAVYDPNGNVATNKSYTLSSSYILGYGLPAYETSPGSHASKLGTYKVTASSLNVRAGASTSDSIVGELKNGELTVVTELSNGWGKVTLADGTTGWCAIGDYGQYIGIDALNTEFAVAWGGDNVSYKTNEYGSVTFTNSGSEGVAVDMPLPLRLGTKTTPSMNLSVTVNQGGWYFGVTQAGSGYFMMRDCNAGDELVQESSAPYMVTDERLQIDIGYWWAPEEGYQIDTLRLYLNANSSVTVNYFYFAAAADTVTDVSYNMRKGGSTEPDPIPTVDLMLPDTLDIVDRGKTGGYVYQNGVLTVTSEDANGYEVSFAPNVSFTPATLKNWVFSVDAKVNYDIELLVSALGGDYTFSLSDDFYPAFGGTAGAEYVPAMNGSAALDLYSCYTWNNIVPADGVSVVKKVTVRVEGVGTVTVNEIQIAATDALTMFADTVTKSDSSSAAAPDRTMGDVNGDNVVTTVDARLIISHLLGASSLSQEALALADYDGNGTVSTADVRAILSSVLV